MRQNKLPFVKIGTPLDLYLPGSSYPRAAHAEEIGEDGLTLLTGVPLYVDMKIGLGIHFPMETLEEFLEQDPGEVQAVVEWTRELGGWEEETRWEAGISFVDLPEADAELIRHFVDYKLQARALEAVTETYDGFPVTDHLRKHIQACEECSRVYGHLWPGESSGSEIETGLEATTELNDNSSIDEIPKEES